MNLLGPQPEQNLVSPSEISVEILNVRNLNVNNVVC